MQFGLLEMWNAMGALAKSVAIILLFLSVITIYFFIERQVVFSKARRKSKNIASKLASLLKAGKITEALTLSSKKENKGSHLARVTAAGIKEFLESGEAGLGKNQKIESVQRGCDRAHAVFAQELKKGLPIVATVATSSPFIGLFGTIAGIINAFRGMALTGSGGRVAIIALWCYNGLNSRTEVIGAEMDNAASEVIDFFVREEQV